MASDKQILITGCSGFIGRHVSAYAVAAGYRVVGLDLKDCDVEGVRFIRGDLRDKNIVENAAKGCDYVIHLGAITIPQRFKEDLVGNYEININGFINVIEAARKNNCKKFLYASSASMYLPESFSEDAVIDTHRQRNHYSKSKMVDEMIADSFNDVYGFKSIGLRFFNVYGKDEERKGQSACALGQFLMAKMNGEPLLIYGDGKQSKDFIYMDDAVKILFLILEKTDSGVYNVGTGVNTQFNTIADLIDKGAKKYIPMPLPTYQYITKADTRRLLSLIGKYKFVSIEEGITELLSYYKLNYGK